MSTRMETKVMHQEMPGSFEQKREALRAALDAHFKAKKPKPAAGGSDDPAPAHCWVGIEATYPSYVIVTVEMDGEPAKTFQVPYSVPSGEVVLGVPVEVKLTVVAAPVGEERTPATAEQTARVRYLEPVAGMLDDATSMVMVSGMEGKAVESLRPGLLRLMDALAVKGMDMTELVDDDDEYEDDGEDGPLSEGAEIADDGEDTEPDSEGYDENDEPEPDAGPKFPLGKENAESELLAEDAKRRQKAEGKAAVLLDPAEVRAQLEELTA